MGWVDVSQSRNFETYDTSYCPPLYLGITPIKEVHSRGRASWRPTVSKLLPSSTSATSRIPKTKNRFVDFDFVSSTVWPILLADGGLAELAAHLGKMVEHPTQPNQTIRPDASPCVEWIEWMSHRKRRETKQQPSMLPGPAVPGCCLVTFRFLCHIHSIHSVLAVPIFLLKQDFSNRKHKSFLWKLYTAGDGQLRRIRNTG